MKFYNQTSHFLIEKFQFVFENAPKFHFMAFLGRNFSKFFKFSKIFVNRAPSARGIPLLGAFGPQIWDLPPTLAKKFLGDDSQKSSNSNLAQW